MFSESKNDYLQVGTPSIRKNSLATIALYMGPRALPSYRMCIVKLIFNVWKVVLKTSLHLEIGTP